MIKENILEYLKEQTAEWVQADVTDMQLKFFSQQDSIIQSLVKALHQLYEEAHSLQEQGRKGEVAFIWIAFLRTSVLNDTWQYRIDLYDNTFVLDREECAVYWKMDFVWDYVIKRMKQLNEVISGGIYANKIRPYHIDKVKLDLAKKYQQQAIYYTQMIIESALQQLDDMDLKKSTKRKVLMGEYLDHSAVIYEKIQDESKKDEAVCNTFD